MNRLRTTLVSLALACTLFSGCTEKDDPDESASPAVQSTAPADPRYATPAALVQHAKTIVDASQPNMHDFYTLFQWETPAQKTWSRYVQFIAVPHGILKREFIKRFPSTPWPGDVPNYFFDIRIPDAKIIKSDDQRAEAAFREGTGPPQTLHLVKMHDRWWISGYSLERARSLDVLHKIAAEAGGPLDVLLSAAASERQGVIDLAERLRMGDIRTVEEFWQAGDELFGGS